MIEKSLGSLLASRRNNFDVLRFVLASAVIASHSKVGIVAEAAGEWQVVQFLGLGRMAVNMFFSISGFLIAKSWLQSRGTVDFGGKRALRIYPGLIVYLMLTLLVFAPLGGGNLAQLLSNPETLRFFAPLVLLSETQLPGVFLDSPYKGIVVGPMWSIRFEIFCYITTAVLGVTTALRRPRLVVAVTAAMLAGFTVQLKLFPRVELVVPLFGNLSEIVRLVSFFLVGSSFYLFRDRIPHSPRVFALAIVVLAATYRWIPSVTIPVFGTYVLLYVSLIDIPYVGGKFKNDISYGMYLYSFPVMQLLLNGHYEWFCSWGRSVGSLLLFASTMLLTSLMASASWFAVEKPCLRLKAHREKARASAIPAPRGESAGEARNVMNANYSRSEDSMLHHLRRHDAPEPRKVASRPIPNEGVPMPKPPLEYFYPEVGVGGFSRVSSTVDFYNRVNALLTPEMTVLNFGAGRGEAYVGKAPYVRELTRIRGKVARVVGVDVDPVVLENPFLDEAAVIKPDGPLPFADESFDLIVCDWVMEHISDPAFVIGEMHRVLKPGGWICARTPNRWGYIAVAASLIPERAHAFVLKIMQPSRKEADTFPKHYKLNTARGINREFGRFGFENVLYTVNSEPAYVGNSRIGWRILLFLFRITPAGLNAFYHVFSRKTPSRATGFSPAHDRVESKSKDVHVPV